MEDPRLQPRRLAIGRNRRRWRRGLVARFVERGSLDRTQLGMPLRARLRRGLRPGPRAANHAAPHEFVTQQPLTPRPLPRPHPLHGRQRHDQQVPRFEHRLRGQPHIVGPGRHVRWRRQMGLVTTRHQHKAAIPLLHILQRPQHPHPLAEAPPVLEVVRNGGISRLVAADERRTRVAGLLTPDFWFAVEDKPRADDLVEIPHQRRMHQQVAERLPRRSRPAQHTLGRPHGVNLPIEPFDLRPRQCPRHVQIPGHVKTVILFVGHHFAVHYAYLLV